MVDVFQISNPDSSGFTWDPKTNLNYQRYYLKELYTEKDLNAYTKLENFFEDIPKRIDYIFLGPLFLLDAKNISITSRR